MGLRCVGPSVRRLPFLLPLLLSLPLQASPLDVRMQGRIVTPNGDGINDGVTFDLVSPANQGLDSEIYSMQGRRVGHLARVTEQQMRWDGRDMQGRTVESGIYVVQIRDGNALWSGVVSVAR